MSLATTSAGLAPAPAPAWPPPPAVRVLLLCESLAVTGGVERFVCELGNALSRRGFVVAIGSVDAPRERVAYPVDAAVRVLSAETGAATAGRRARGGGKLALLRAQWRVGRALGAIARTEDADVLVLNGVVLTCAVLALQPELAVQAICCDHNHFAARSRFWQTLRRWLYRRVAAVVSLTEADRPRFAALNANTHVIANASVLSADVPSQVTEPVVLAIGRHQVQKGFDLLLQAWRKVAAARPEARLRIVGTGPLGGELRALAESLGVAGSVDWLAPTPTIETQYRQAAIFVLSSRYEGMPLALLEAQALGVPAVAFDCPTGPGEIVTAETGIVVPAEDIAALAHAIEGLLADPERRHRMGVAAIERSRQRFSPRAHFDAWATLIANTGAKAAARRLAR